MSSTATEEPAGPGRGHRGRCVCAAREKMEEEGEPEGGEPSQVKEGHPCHPGAVGRMWHGGRGQEDTERRGTSSVCRKGDEPLPGTRQTGNAVLSERSAPQERSIITRTHDSAPCRVHRQNQRGFSKERRGGVTESDGLGGGRGGGLGANPLLRADAIGDRRVTLAGKSNT